MTDKSDPSMLFAMKELKKLRTDGERTRWLDNYFGLDDPSHEVIRCLRCRDSGYATIYHPAVIVAAAAAEKDPPWHRHISVRCNCDAGLRMPAQSQEQVARSANHAGDEDYVHGKQCTYGDDVWHIAVNDPDGKAKCCNFEFGRLHEWKPYSEHHE